MTNPSNRKMSQKSQGMRDETTRASVSATQGATCIGRPFMAASSIMPVHSKEALMGDRVKLTSMAKAAG
jgi:hypothetical protein